MADPRGAPPPSSDRAWWTVHLWHIQWVRDLMVVAGAIWLVYLGYVISLVTVPLLLALFLAYLFEPLVQFLTRRGWVSRQGTAVGMIVAVALLVVVPLGLGVGFAAVQGTEYVLDMASNVGKLNQALEKSPGHDDVARQGLANESWRKIYDALRPPAPAPEPVGRTRRAAVTIIQWASTNADAITKAVSPAVLGTGAEAAVRAVRAVGSLGKLLFTGFLTAFFFYFFSTGWGAVLRFWEGLIPERKKGRVIELVHRMDAVIAGFVRGRLIICALLMVYITAAYWAIGVPAPLILGPLVGALFLVPYASGIVGVPLAILLMWLQPAGSGWQSAWWWIVGAPIGVQIVAQILDDYVLTPRIQGKATGLEMPAIVFASITGGVLAGVYGLLLAIPTAACVKILLGEIFWPRFRRWAEGKESDVLPIGQR